MLHVASHLPHAGTVCGRFFPADSEYAHILGTQVPVRADADFTHIGEIAGLDQQASQSQQLQPFSNRLGDSSTLDPAPNMRAFITKHMPKGPTPSTTTVSSKRNDSLGKADICLARSKPTVTAMISVNTAISDGNSSGTLTTKLPGTT